jgi:outer membrane murein-binding lipoprotein Lpp
VKYIRKAAAVVLLSLALTGCNSAEFDKLQDQAVILQQEKDQLTKEVTALKADLEQKDQKVQELTAIVTDYETQYDVSIEDIRFISEDMYQDGEKAGHIYGKFNAVVTVRNNLDHEMKNIKVTARLESSFSDYPKAAPKVTATKMDVIKQIGSGETKEIFFSDLTVDHPEVIQELFINVVGQGEAEKIKIPVAFPPGSQD